ncbi:MAG: hypothetical protein NWF06_07080 [Candidatus Bathyarchaeota archaeon]|nr:hypothetical protein [Candidatus Bathyarchaeum sp.]
MSSFYSMMPLKFLSGKAVFDYRKDFSLIALASTGSLFFSCTLNSSNGVLLGTGGQHQIA